MSGAPIAPDALGRLLQQLIREEAERITIEEANAASERVRKRLSGMVDQIALNVFGHYRIELRAGELIIRVDRTELERKL